MTTDEPVDPDQFVEVDGRRIYFCCAKCRHKYERDPEAYAASVAAVMPASIRQAPPQDADGDDSPDADDAAHQETDDHEHEASPDGAEGGDADDHDHDAAESEGRILAWLGTFHPPATHFPIAMLLGAVVAEALLVVTGRGLFATGARFCLWVGALGAVGAAVLGWLFAGLSWSGDDTLLSVHRWLGTGVPVLAVAALVLREVWERRPRDGVRLGYRAALALAAVAVAVNGFLGGAMIYGLDQHAF